MVLSALFVFPTLLSSRAPTRDLHLRLSKALVILTASDLFEQREEIPHLRAGRQREASVLFQRGETCFSIVFPALSRDLHLRLSKALGFLTASVLFKRQEESPHLRAGRQREASVLFQRGELAFGLSSRAPTRDLLCISLKRKSRSSSLRFSYILDPSTSPLWASLRMTISAYSFTVGACLATGAS